MENKRIYSVLKSIKAVSLVELIVAMAILAIIASPFIAISINSAINNQYAEEKMNTSSVVQNLNEEIKARSSQWFESEVEYFSSLADQYKVSERYSNSDMQVSYRIENVTEGEIGDKNIYSSFTDDNYNKINYDIEFYVKSNKFILNNMDCSLLSPYYLEIDNAGYTISNKIKAKLKSGKASGKSINILIQVDETLNSNFELHNIINKDVSSDVKYYINGNDSKVMLINDGEESFYRYNNLLKDYISQYKDRLYRIDIKIKKGNEDINGMMSYVKK